jgi:ADP-ribose pyrophosphatase YjhB (NUDIX family)
METTRHFTATCYIVEGGATALHEHPGLGVRVPPGGHVARDELPHETALRECREETGLDPTLLRQDRAPVESATGHSLPQPRRQMLYDVNIHGDSVGHQHVDHVYFAAVASRAIDPDDGEVGAGSWAWYTPGELRRADVHADVVDLGTAAVEAAER